MSPGPKRVHVDQLDRHPDQPPLLPEEVLEAEGAALSLLREPRVRDRAEQERRCHEGKQRWNRRGA